jgi:hypothetical protein
LQASRFFPLFCFFGFVFDRRRGGRSAQGDFHRGAAPQLSRPSMANDNSFMRGVPPGRWIIFR